MTNASHKTTLDIHRYMRGRVVAAAALPLLALFYLAYVGFAFDVPKLMREAEGRNAAILLRDASNYKIHVDTPAGQIKPSVSVEGERKGRFADDQLPAWVEPGTTQTIIDLGADGSVSVRPTITTIFTADRQFEIQRDGRKLRLVTAPDILPENMRVGPRRITLTGDNSRVTITPRGTLVYRYFFGWEMFWFARDSRFADMSLATLMRVAAVDDRVDPEHTNVSLMLSDVWYNPVWRHNEVVWAIGETLLMAFLGTLGGAILAMPLALLAARNINPLAPARAFIRRVLDFVRGVDALVWTIVLARAFGPGPMTGTLAIMITDAGGLGKMFSEAAESANQRTLEGVKSTGASSAPLLRFGLLPQILPVLVSQTLYLFESNIRSATIVGAIVGGGIGLLITQSLATQKDWEEVAYYLSLIIVMIMFVDHLSSRLRLWLIHGDK